MDFGEVFRVIRRRWKIAVSVLVLTVIAVAVVYAGWPTKYQSTAELSLIGSSAMAAQPPNGNNPYVVVGGLEPLANILASDLSSGQAGQQLQALGMTNGFTATVPAFAAGPFISLTVTGRNSSSVLGSMPVVINFAKKRLQQLQETGAVRTPSAGLIGAVVIAPAGSPQPVLKTKIELVAGVAIAGLVLILLLSFAAEGRALRQAQRREMLSDSRAAEMPHQGDEPEMAPVEEEARTQ
jgi:hypothetical protein